MGSGDPVISLFGIGLYFLFLLRRQSYFVSRIIFINLLSGWGTLWRDGGWPGPAQHNELCCGNGGAAQLAFLGSTARDDDDGGSFTYFSLSLYTRFRPSCSHCIVYAAAAGYNIDVLNR